MDDTQSLSARTVGKKSRALHETPTAIDLGHLFRACQRDGELGLVTGEPGTGKTSAARRYAAEADGAFLITMSPATSALVPCLERIGQTIGANATGSGSSAWTDAIRAKLRYEGGTPLLLIDEAHHLSDLAAEEVRAIFDASPALGVVFIGSRELRRRWAGPRWAQFTSRIYQRVDLEAADDNDVDAMCEFAGLDDRRSRNLMRKAAARPGGLRHVAKLLDVAQKLAGSGAVLTADHIEAAFRDREAA